VTIAGVFYECEYFFLIAIWAIVTGIIRVIAAVSMYKQKQGTWLLGISALASVLFGLMIIFKPYQQNTSMVWMISTFLLFFGALTIIIGIYFREVK
jgi:uncharacterized membrane protein HdeD (DUF308 family)